MHGIGVRIYKLRSVRINVRASCIGATEKRDESDNIILMTPCDVGDKGGLLACWET